MLISDVAASSSGVEVIYLVIRRKRIYFSKHFAIVLPLIFNELFGTNPN